MTTLLLIGATLIWGVAWFKSSALLTRIAVLVQATGVCTALFIRNDLPPSGWVSVALLLSLIPALAALFQPNHPLIKQLTPLLTLAAAVSAAIADVPPGPGVAIWSPWSIPHIILAVTGTGAAAAAAMLSLHHLAGKKTGLLLLAIVLTALPLLHPRATAVTAHNEDGALTVTASIISPDGDAGIERTLPAQMQLPYEQIMRWGAIIALLIMLGLTVIGGDSELKAARKRSESIGLGILLVHIALLSSAMIPRTIGEGEAATSEIVEAAKSTLQLEARGGEYVTNVKTANPPYTGGPGAVPIVLPLALIVFALVFQGTRPPTNLAMHGYLRLEANIVSVATVLMAGTLVTGMLWSNFAWGAALVADPKLFAAAVTIGLYGLYFFCQRWLPEHKEIPSTLALLAFGVILLSMAGPELGWTAPTLHHFGP